MSQVAMEDEEHFISTRVKRNGPSVCCIIATILGVVLAASVATNIGLSVGIYKVMTSDKQPDGPANTTNATACDTPECVELGAQVLASLDEAFDPCVDFYKFACKKSLDQAIIPYGSQTTGAFEKLTDLQQERFRIELSKSVNTTVEAVGKVMTYYQSCANTSTGPDPQAHASLIQLLTDLGGWPLVGIGDESSQTYNINDEGGFLTEILYGSSAFFAFKISANPENSSNNILTVDQGGLTIPDESVYKNATFRKALKDHMVTMIKTINPNISNSVYEAAIDDVISFEEEIAGFTDFEVMKRPFFDRINVMTFESLIEWMPEFHWLQNFKYYGHVGGTPIEVNNSTPVDVYAPSSFLTGLNALIANTSATTLQNYAKWHLVFGLLPLVGQESARAYHSITNLMTGMKYDEASPTYKPCISLLEQAMPFAMARVLIEAYPPNGVEGNISVVITGLRAALKERISEKDWLDSTTKQRALNKVDKIVDFLVYPNYDNAKLNSMYASLNVSVTVSYLGNYLNLTKFIKLNQIVRLSHIISRNDWNPDISPTQTNAVYSPFGNQIYILYGILNIPFFKAYWPDYFKFGTIGHVVGHELVHGFDNSGRRFDENGNFANWWSQQAVDEFDTRAQCFVDQYNQYSLPAGPVNGTKTLGENIADNGGLATAYRAYKNMEGTGKMLPGLKYTPDQLFFIGSAQQWCQVATLSAQQQLLQDVHTPASLRPLGFLSNSPEFAAAFNCPSGSRMNPTHKCEIW